MLEPLRRPLNITELGCGNGEKLAILLEKVASGFDACTDRHLWRGARERSRAAGHAAVHAGHRFQGTYEQGLARLATHRSHGNWLVLFLGSNIGNFDPPAARDMLRRIRGSLTEGDALLLGTDLVKSPRVLQLRLTIPCRSRRPSTATCCDESTTSSAAHSTSMASA